MSKKNHKKQQPLQGFSWLRRLFQQNRYLRYCILSLPVLLFVIGFIWKPNSAITGDWDYFLQLYEAFRKAVLQYGQFPWWNPWVAGGVPLYANPQFGLISIQSPLVLLLGSLYGLKISVLFYYLIGFWGMYLLVNRISGGDSLKSILLGYIFCFGGFAVFHVAGGHLTFAMYYMVPLLFYLFINRNKAKSSWLWFALYLAIFINSAPHYIVIQACLLLTGIYVFDYIRRYKFKLGYPIKTDVQAICLAVILSVHKLLFSYQYIQDFPRLLDPQKPVALSTLLSSLFQPFYFGHLSASALNLQFGWGEYSAYIGFLMIFIIGLCLYDQVKNKQHQNPYSIFCFVAALVAVIIAAGPFFKLAPYRIMLRLPVFSAMGVPSRWLGWASLFLLLGLAFYKFTGRLIYILLGITALELFIIHSMTFYRDYHKFVAPAEEKDFQQFVDYKADDPNRFYKATLANRGEVRGYEPILGYNYNDRPTKRTGINYSGKIISDNARISYWSPNKIVVTRLAPGNIELNVNPGNYWRINGVRQFRDMRVTEPNELFTIDDPSETIVCEIEPSYSLLIPGVK